MKLVLQTLILFVLVSGPAIAETALDKMKTLVGEWETAISDEKRPGATAKYVLISNGTAVMETLDSEGSQMVSIYHMNGDKLMMTHYCNMNNQPRLEGSVTDNSITFVYKDATNLSKPSDPHISGLVVNFKDPDHFSQQWSNNAEADKMTIEFQRKK